MNDLPPRFELTGLNRKKSCTGWVYDLVAVYFCVLLYFLLLLSDTNVIPDQSRTKSLSQYISTLARSLLL